MPIRPPIHRSHGTKPPEQAYDMRRGSAASRGYDRDWRKLRAAVLFDEPLCRFCQEQGRITEATEVDHIKSIAERPDLRLERSNLRPLCTPCHSGRTRRQTSEKYRT
jgi:5-methylcytosine-specific restriction protein A